MTAPISQQELESYLWGAATHLRGHVSAGDYKQFIFPLLFFKRLSDVYDDEFSTAYKAFAAEPKSLASAWARWKADGETFWRQMDDVTAMLDGK